MFRHNLFSTRRKTREHQVPEVYQYDTLSPKLRLQLARIVQRTFGRPGQFSAFVGHRWLEPYFEVNRFVAEEHGRVTLGTGDEATPADAIFSCLQNEQDLDIVFDLLEVILNHAGNLSWEYRSNEHVENSQAQSIQEVNARLRENGVGYHFQNRQFIRIDTEVIHHEVVIPALTLLNDPQFAGANAEFLHAHDQFKAGEFELALVEATKALESTLKIICTQHAWPFDPNATAKKLLQVVLDHQLVPTYLQHHFSNLAPLLESAATPRNKTAGHGQGAEVRHVPEYLAQFALNMTATVIVLLVKANAELGA